MDFTISKYLQLIKTLQMQGFQFLTVRDYFRLVAERSLPARFAILRHDVDAKPGNSLGFAKIQHEQGIRGSYYFRVVPDGFNEMVIREIDGMGHETGYHYETMETIAGKWGLVAYGIRPGKKHGMIEKHEREERLDLAYAEFCMNLEMIRRIARVETVCMHGSPGSGSDNREIWQKYDYKALGILGEPYLDIDFNDVFYLTDTGRRWDGWNSSIRDTIPLQQTWTNQGLVYHSTDDIIRAAGAGTLPERILFTFHPQRWFDNPLEWTKELLVQNLKNVVKRGIVKARGSRDADDSPTR
jgi:hypothetical protein